jgi:hypothetical protein
MQDFALQDGEPEMPGHNQHSAIGEADMKPLFVLYVRRDHLSAYQLIHQLFSSRHGRSVVDCPAA